MSSITEPIRQEHAELAPHIDALRAAADAVGDVSADALHKEVDQAYEFLVEHLIPHATAEDQVLYPVVAGVMGAPEATATMRRDHVAVVRFTEELGELRRITGELGPGELRALRRVLYGLHALVSTHFAKEEEIYLQLLDERLTAEDAEQMFRHMEAAAAAARPKLVH